jgi:hypothetical protein
MGEFKKGDEVRLIKSEDYNGHGRYGKTGEIGTVIRYDAIDDTYNVDFSESGQWWAKASNLELSAATLKIEAGKFYKTRDGRKAKVECAHYGESYDFVATFDGWPGNKVYKKDGKHGSRWIANNPSDDIIAEWIDEPVAKPSNDNAKPKFKVGDIVKRSNGFMPHQRLRITKVEGERYSVEWLVGGPGSIDTWRGYEFELVTPAPTPTSIVALIESGQPKPSSTPHVHTSTGAAEKEAKRLAAKYKGQQFGVFTLTTTHEEAAPVYDHKWQNMAALGLKIDAIKELRAVAGLTLKGAKDAVEAWIEYENAA